MIRLDNLYSQMTSLHLMTQNGTYTNKEKRAIKGQLHSIKITCDLLIEDLLHEDDQLAEVSGDE